MQLCDYESQEVPQSVVCKLENQGSQWRNSVQVQRLRTRSSKSRRWMSQQREKAKLSSSAFFFSIQIFRGLDDTYPHWGGKSFLLSLRIQMLISFTNALSDTQK